MDVETQNLEKSKGQAWLEAMRFRTLPLALASTLTGAFLVIPTQNLNVPVLALTVLTTILLQINSNLANDYGDFSHGTDNKDRIGPERAMQSGRITEREMRRAIILFSLLSLVSGTLLVLIAPLIDWLKVLLFLLGCAAIYASVRYTAGSNPYGYRGLGDLSVMLFFGILGVIGSNLCQTGSFDSMIILPALTIGALSTGVLNVNNTRDLESDLKAGKRTLAVRMGPVNARIYHLVLLAVAMLSITLYGWIKFEGWSDWIFLITFPLFVFNGVRVFTISDARKLDPYLKQLAVSTFLFSLFLGIGLAI